jgi:hypothetical protein
MCFDPERVAGCSTRCALILVLLAIGVHEVNSDEEHHHEALVFNESCTEIPLESGLDHHGQDAWIGAAVSLCARSNLASSWRGAPDIVGGWQCRTDSVDCFSAGMRIGTLPEDARPTGTALYAVRVCPRGRCPSAEGMHGDVMIPTGLRLKADPDGALTLIIPEGGHQTNATVMAVGGLLSSPIAIGWARGETYTGFRGLT